MPARSNSPAVASQGQPRSAQPHRLYHDRLRGRHGREVGAIVGPQREAVGRPATIPLSPLGVVGLVVLVVARSRLAVPPVNL
jgi:hypothetical protein